MGVIDCFSGIGGFRTAIENLGEDILANVEIDTHAQQSYRLMYQTDGETHYSDMTDETIPWESYRERVTGVVGGFPCFAGDTKVLTKQGYRAIKDIQIGDEVLTHLNRYQKVLNVYNQGVKDVVYLMGEGFKTLKVTPNHKMYARYLDEFSKLQDAQWVEVQHLTDRHYLGIPLDRYEDTQQELPDLTRLSNTLYEDNYIWLKHNRVVKSEHPDTVYDIEVEEDHSFTAHNIIVHNCQAFSLAGKQLGFEDTRGTLFFNLADVVLRTEPDWFMMENVKGLLSHNKGQTFQTILNTFEQNFSQYDIQYGVLNSKYHVPQNRERIFILGTKKEFKFNPNHLQGLIKQQTQLPLTIQDILMDDDLIDRGWITNKSMGHVFTYLEPNWLEILEQEPQTNIVKVTNYSRTKYGSGLVMGVNGITGTLMARDNKGPKAIMYEVGTQPQDGKPYLELNKNGLTSHHTITQHYTNKYTSDTPRYFRVRHLQPLEYFRLQGFTDEQYYKASQETARGQLYKQAGNSVTVPVIQLILADVIQHINQIKKT